MSPFSQQDAKKACEHFSAKYTDICDRIASENAVIPRLADLLESAKLITRDTKGAVCNTTGLAPYNKATKLLQPVKGRIENKPELIEDLIAVFRKCELNDLADDLERGRLMRKRCMVLSREAGPAELL